eukprot:TRINITY_DN7189_c0_g1_i1.p1 TRINITY_DN7189_c0_g1~~TRINITY_DN7189_c0_g1_i1.p1  ORF type:complete len:562 (-),score=171.19 TRINITY_DN7189_c0_g1_i1:36-1721(-)
MTNCERLLPLSQLLIPKFENDPSEAEMRVEIMQHLQHCKSQQEREVNPSISFFYHTFCAPENKKRQARIVKELGGLEVFISIINDTNLSEASRSYALYSLWNLSALAENKVILYELGIVDAILKMKYESSSRTLIGISAILQNVSEHRFEQGAKNPNQVHIYQNGVFKFMCENSLHSDLFVRFLSCMGIANLSYNLEVRKLMREEGCESVLQNLLLFITHFESIKQSDPYSKELFEGWLSLQPHVPLLSSEDERIQMWALFCLNEFTSNAMLDAEMAGKRPNNQQIWKSVGLNDGIRSIQNLTLSSNPIISKMASKLIFLMGIEESMGLSYQTCSNIGNDFQFSLENGRFSDVTFECLDKVQIRAHKVILVSRCEQLGSMFEGGMRESRMEVIPIQFNSQVFKLFLQFLYTASTPNITPTTALELLHCSDMFTIDDLKRHVEEYLWNYVDHTNVCMILEATERHQCSRLRKLCVEYIIRNYKKVERTEDWRDLNHNLKDPISNYRLALDSHIALVNAQSIRIVADNSQRDEELVREAVTDYLNYYNVPMALPQTAAATLFR